MRVIYIVEVDKAGGDKDEHITAVKWEDRTSGRVTQTDVMTTADMVRWIDSRQVDVRVYDPIKPPYYVEVGVVRASRPYLRTHRDGVTVDNLRNLPAITRR